MISQPTCNFLSSTEKWCESEPCSKAQVYVSFKDLCAGKVYLELKKKRSACWARSVFPVIVCKRFATCSMHLGARVTRFRPIIGSWKLPCVDTLSGDTARRVRLRPHHSRVVLRLEDKEDQPEEHRLVQRVGRPRENWLQWTWVSRICYEGMTLSLSVSEASFT